MSKESEADPLFRAECALEALLAFLDAGWKEVVVKDKEGGLRSAASSRPTSGASDTETATTNGSRGSSYLQQQQQEALIYAAGALKNVSVDAGNQRTLFAAGAVAVAGRVLLRVASGSSGDEASGKTRDAHLAVKIEGLIRNLALVPAHAREAARAGVIPALLSVAQRWHTHRELMRNVARVLSKLSLEPACRAALGADVAGLAALLTVLELHADDAPLAARLAFALANLTTHEAQTRDLMHAVRDVHLRLTELLRRFATTPTATTTMSDEAKGGGKSKGTSSTVKEKTTDDERREVLIRLVRLVANLALHPGAAATLARDPDVLQILLEVLRAHPWGGIPVSRLSDEVALNAASALTNLTFVVARAEDEEQEQEGSESSTKKSSHAGASPTSSLPGAVVLSALESLLLSGHDEAAAEAARLLGNLSRWATFRNALARSALVEACCLLLDHPAREVRFAVCGVLVNLAADRACAPVILHLEAPAGLVRVLDRAWDEVEGAEEIDQIDPVQNPSQETGEIDVEVALVALKALANALHRAGDVATLTSEEVEGAMGRISQLQDHAALLPSSSHRDIVLEVGARVLTLLQDVPVLVLADGEEDEEDDNVEQSGQYQHQPRMEALPEAEGDLTVEHALDMLQV